MVRTRRPRSARAAATFSVLVVLAVPPFWLKKAITRVMVGGNGPFTAVNEAGSVPAMLPSSYRDGKTACTLGGRDEKRLHARSGQEAFSCLISHRSRAAGTGGGGSPHVAGAVGRHVAADGDQRLTDCMSCAEERAPDALAEVSLASIPDVQISVKIIVELSLMPQVLTLDVDTLGRLATLIDRVEWEKKIRVHCLPPCTPYRWYSGGHASVLPLTGGKQSRCPVSCHYAGRGAVCV